ncbi:hypothetical protein VTK56DRAFT_2596 [Thermocarpiscus australiensis]
MEEEGTPPSPPTRRTRVVCISDTHNHTVKLPKGDILIHAGDLTNQGSYSELSKALQWQERADFEAKIVIAGNHDITLDRVFYSKHGSSFHNQIPMDPDRCLSLLASSRTVTYLQHCAATIRLTDPKGPGTKFTVFGSPYSPECGTWAFGYRRSGRTANLVPHGAAATSLTAAELWAAVPLDTDILITHTPPYSHCDGFLGCEELHRTLARVRPRLHVCGHVHQARGAERVRWDTDSPGVDDICTEATVERWEDPSPDPASAKMSLVDLTSRGGKRPLEFLDSAPPRGAQPLSGVSCDPSVPGPGSQGRVGLTGRAGWDDSSGPSRCPNHGFALANGMPELGLESNATAQASQMGRLGRRETCIINCAIVATSWHHRGGKQLNKPIVVDLDLPVWR